MNTRGIPPATYQVLHMLSYSGGYPIPKYPPPRARSGWGYPILGYPHPGAGYPPGGELGPVTGVLPKKGPGTSHQGTSKKDMGAAEVLWDGDGVPPRGVNRQTPVKT